MAKTGPIRRPGPVCAVASGRMPRPGHNLGLGCVSSPAPWPPTPPPQSSPSLCIGRLGAPSCKYIAQISPWEQNPSSLLLPAAASLPLSPLLLYSASSSPAAVTEWWRGRWVATGGPRHHASPQRRASSPPGEHAAIEWLRHGALGPQRARSPKIR
jgi:hypothetical protein